MSIKFVHLTRNNIRALEPGQSISEHGIQAARLSNSDIRYAVNIMIDGQRVHRTIGRESEGVTRTQAEEFISSARNKVREGRLDLPSNRKISLTFSSAADDYIVRLNETGGKNIEKKSQHIKDHLKPFFRNQPLDKLTDFTVGRYSKRRSESGAKAGTINRELATLSHLMSKALEWKWIKSKPCKISRLREGPGRIFAMSDEQCQALIEAAMADQDSDLWLFVLVGLNTAMRHREILRIRFDQINFDALRIHVPEAKSGERSQPITRELAEILVRERLMRDDESGFVFPARRKSGQPHRYDFTDSFRRAVKRAGLDTKTVTPHTMRHTAITKLVQAGVDIPTIQRISGHKTIQMVMRYTHVHAPHIDAALNHLSYKPNSDTITQELHNDDGQRAKR